MEFFDYLRHIYRYKIWLLVGLIAGGALVGIYAANSADRYQATMSLYTKRQSDASTPAYFTYEGYYAQQTATNFTETAIKMLSNDEVIRRAAALSGMPEDTASIQKLRKAITTKKEAPQLIKLTVVLPNAEDASAFSKGLAQSLKDRTAELNQSGDSRLAVDEVNPEPFVVSARPWWPLFAIVGALFGLIVAIVASAIWSYTKSHRHRR